MKYTENFIVDMYASESLKIKSGTKKTVYMQYCVGCKKYKILYMNPRAYPGGTPSCPVCKELKINGPHIESAYGIIKSKKFEITLPKEVDGYDA